MTLFQSALLFLLLASASGCSVIQAHLGSAEGDTKAAAPVAVSEKSPPQETAIESAPETSTAEPDQPDPVDADAESPALAKEFDPEAMYSLLVAEMAGYRNQFDVALAQYLAQAKRTGDPAIAERATRIAQYLNATEPAAEAASIWAASDPENLEAHETAAQLLVRGGRYEDALAHLEHLLSRRGEAGFDFLALNAQDLNDESRQQILNAFDNMLVRHPQHPQLLFGKAILRRQLGDIDGALALARDLPSIAPDYEQGYILAGRLLHENGSTPEALEKLAVAVEKFPDNVRIRQQYARILLEDGQLEKAREQFTALLKAHPEDPNLAFSIALINVEMEDFESAAVLFEQMIKMGHRVDESHYYLGTIAEKRGDIAAAMTHYGAVSVQAESLAAQARIAQLLVENEGFEAMRSYLGGIRTSRPDLDLQVTLLEIEILTERDQFDHALIVATEALHEKPGDPTLLYSRAMIHDALGDLAQLEADLRKILADDAENAVALNALGYTLADRTDRYEEAFELIVKAHQLKPDDPAITDSLGWIHYRMGNYEEAIKHLRKAYQAFPDHEVAAHLGEVLWVTGQLPEARKVWQEALKKTPDSDLLRDAMERFKVQP